MDEHPRAASIRSDKSVALFVVPFSDLALILHGRTFRGLMFRSNRAGGSVQRRNKSPVPQAAVRWLIHDIPGVLGSARPQSGRCPRAILRTSSETGRGLWKPEMRHPVPALAPAFRRARFRRHQLCSAGTLRRTSIAGRVHYGTCRRPTETRSAFRQAQSKPGGLAREKRTTGVAALLRFEPRFGSHGAF